MMLLKVLQRLDRRRFSPQVISLSTMGELAPRITAIGIPVQALGMNLRMPSPAKFFRLVRILRCLHPDLVHTWLYHADLLGGLAARLAGISAVGWCVRNSDLDRGDARLAIRAVVRLSAWLSKWVPRRILSCSEKARQLHVGYGYAAEKMLVVPNGFDIAQFVPNAQVRTGVRKDLGLARGHAVGGADRQVRSPKKPCGIYGGRGCVASPHAAGAFCDGGQTHRFRQHGFDAVDDGCGPGFECSSTGLARRHAEIDGGTRRAGFFLRLRRGISQCARRGDGLRRALRGH